MNSGTVVGATVALTLLAVPAAAETDGLTYPVPDTPYTRDLVSVAPGDLEPTGIYEGSPKWLADKEGYAARFYDTLASFKRYLDEAHTSWEIAPIPQKAPPPCDQPQPTRYDAEGCRYVNALFKELAEIDPEEARRRREAVRRGRDVWFKGTFGDQDFYEVYVAEEILGEMPDYSSWLDTRNRDARFRDFGLINDPGCKGGSAETFWMDDCDDPFSTGVLGLRKYPRAASADFDPATSPYEESEIKTLKRYSIGFACALCHVGFDPTNPPEDPDAPKWESLMGGIGNQYIRHGKLFTLGKPEGHIVREIFAAQRPGTIDPTISANDFIHNPLAINAIMNTHLRPLYELPMKHPVTGEVKTGKTHISLKGGEDSMGDRLALLRVYVNIGMCALECWTPKFPEHGAFFGEDARQQPFRIAQCARDCEAWNHAEAKMEDLLAYLLTVGPTYLDKASDVDGTPGASYIDAALVPQGRRVYIERCTECHTTKPLPDFVDRSDAAMVQDFYKGHIFGGFHAWQREFEPGLVGSPELAGFLDPATGLPKQIVDGDQDWLGDDRRSPYEEIGVNPCRAFHSNNVRGHIWEEFSSEAFHDAEPRAPHPVAVNHLLPAIGGTTAFDAAQPIEGGRGYLRNVSLLSIWSSSPFLHNNALGPYPTEDDGTPKYSVKARVEAFEAAMRELLTSDDAQVTPHREPAMTLAPMDIEVPTRPDGNSLISFTLPKGAPIGHMASVNPHRPLFSQCDDYVENKGHQFGIDLSEEDKTALIEFLKSL